VYSVVSGAIDGRISSLLDIA